MAIRTIMTSVTFNNPFSLGAHNDPQPAGEYTVETDEERLEGLSFTSYRRVRTFIHIPARPDSRSISEVLVVEPSDLEFALDLDAGLSLAYKDSAAERQTPRTMQFPALPGDDCLAMERSEDEAIEATSA
ncbi:MAG: hypothetical protein WEA84_14230 [Rhodovibrionaceae bacterium]